MTYILYYRNATEKVFICVENNEHERGAHFWTVKHRVVFTAMNNVTLNRYVLFPASLTATKKTFFVFTHKYLSTHFWTGRSFSGYRSCGGFVFTTPISRFVVCFLSSRGCGGFVFGSSFSKIVNHKVTIFLKRINYILEVVTDKTKDALRFAYLVFLGSR